VIRVTFLGTSASRPTVGRNVSAIAIQREGDMMLFDCGEGTQRQMIRYATGFAVEAIFVTHLHADHFLGITGLLRTLALQGRTEPIQLFGPPGSSDVLHELVHLGVDRVHFGVEIDELAPGARVRREGYAVEAFRVHHGTSAVGYALVEDVRKGRFDVARARALGVPEGPLFGRLHRGETVEVEGRPIHPEEVVGPPRRGRIVAYTGDTRPDRRADGRRKGVVDLLIHEATFGADEDERARETFHSTARGAARAAREWGARRLVLTHLSARYSDDPAPLEEEARSVFPGARVAYDGMTLELPYPDDDEEPAGGGAGKEAGG